MRKQLLYALFFLSMLCMYGCDSFQKKKTDWHVSLKKEDKNPYGTYVAYQSMKYYFPGAKIEPLSNGFRYTNMGDKMKSNYSGTSLLILVGLDFYVSQKEWRQLVQFANRGDEVLIFCSQLDYNVERQLRYIKKGGGYEQKQLGDYNTGRENIDALSLSATPQKWYGYEGRSLQGYFVSDTSGAQPDDDEAYNKNANTTYNFPTPDSLGYAGTKLDYVRFSVGNGHISLHAAPLVLSNYFLLQKDNKDYLTALWRNLPPNINRIYWQEYYKRTNTPRMSVLWRYPATRLAIILGILALLLYVLFEGKRKQRIIPIISPLKNDSASFVETVGRLYYNKGDHTNLAEKMIQQFLEWVRTHYFLNTNHLNEAFVQQLIIKSGRPEHVVRNMMDMIHEVRLNKNIDEAYLYQLYNTMQRFYL